MFAGGFSSRSNLSPIADATNDVQEEVIETVEIEVRTESSEKFRPYAKSHCQKIPSAIIFDSKKSCYSCCQIV